MSAPVIQCRLRRKDTSQSWGFRMKGGAEQGIPLFIEAVNPRGIAAAQGVSKGDVILSICGANMQGNSHMAAKQEILRAGNELDMVVHKAGISEDHPIARQAAAQDADRVQIVEERTQSFGGPTYKDVKPKTYQILQEELKASEQGGMTPQQQNEAFLKQEAEERARHQQAYQQQQAQFAAQGGGGKPSSIFDRPEDERSAYLQAQGPTIQKAYGQKY